MVKCAKNHKSLVIYPLSFSYLCPALETTSHIRLAEKQDIVALKAVINKAYEVEHYIKDDERTDETDLEKRFAKGYFIIAEEENKIVASIYVELRGERSYFGMLAVHPDHQGKKLGFKLIQEAENFAREKGAKFMDIQILSVRKELPPFYRMVGYAENGTTPLPKELDTKIPCHFINMTKVL
ncbi:MAG: acetyltransferase, family [Bacteroidetes bacterium]|jgi:predicted N-acetyltransferase YhbS|nr:acetyltransferase, family [Bacteroidota bacterium]